MVLVMFVNFMFMNTVFMHSHHGIDGRMVTHSHPYVPSSSHTHSALSLDQIAGFNLSASSAQASSVLIANAPSACVISDTYITYCPHTAKHPGPAINLRAPQMA